jgi:uncharacterized protein YihD (DUF1040 family)
MNDQKRIEINDEQRRVAMEFLERYWPKTAERDPKRIDEILAELRELWMKCPDLRLGQLVVNIIGPSQPTPEVFYVEDDEFLVCLRKFREKSNEAILAASRR